MLFPGCRVLRSTDRKGAAARAGVALMVRPASNVRGIR